MSIKNLMETKFPKMYSSIMYTDNYDVDASHTGIVLETLMMGTSMVLQNCRSKEYPVSMVFRKSNGDFIAAATVYFDENDVDVKGNAGAWNLSWTTFESDIPENARIKTPYDGDIAKYFRSFAHSKFHMGFESVECMGDMYCTLLKQMMVFLAEVVATEGKTTVVLDGIVQFDVDVEDEEVVISITPMGEVKEKVKADVDMQI